LARLVRGFHRLFAPGKGVGHGGRVIGRANTAVAINGNQAANTIDTLL
jgi:hypothetical protein